MEDQFWLNKENHEKRTIELEHTYWLQTSEKSEYTTALVSGLWHLYLLLTEFEVRTLSYGPRFFPFNLWPKREARDP